VIFKSNKKFYLVGISYKNADLQTRGKFNLNKTLSTQLLKSGQEKNFDDLFVLSTCNRTEVYAIANNSNELIDLLCENSIGTKKVLKKLGYVMENQKAINHLFRVGAGLDSQILGDFEIIGQIKQSFSLAKNLAIKNFFIERLLNHVIQASKLIKNKTNISSGAASLSFASVQYIINNVKKISEKKILLFGTGKIGRNTCENLIKHTKNDHIYLINRTKEKAEKVAMKFNVKVRDYGSLPSEISDADILIVATSSLKPTIEKDLIFSSKKLLILDLSIPSNVDSNVEDLKNIKLINLDELSQITDQTQKNRSKQVPKAERIIKTIENEFMEWIRHRQFVPTIKAFREKLISEQKGQITNKFRKRKKSLSINCVSDNIIEKLTGQFASYIKDNPDKAYETTSMMKNIFELDIKSDE
jgi:glutamyl-tRNA reductase